MIKIIYIYFGGDLSTTLPGVHNKLVAKINNLNSHRSTCLGLTVGSEVSNKKDCIEIIHFDSTTSFKYFDSIYKNKQIFKILIDYLLPKKDEFDFIIFRYPLASRPLKKFMEIFNNCVIIEHNTLEIPELKLNFKMLISGTKFSLKPGYFINILENGFFPIFRELYYRKSISQNNYFKIFVSKEIKDYYSNISKTNDIIISNSIDASIYPERKFVNNENNEIRIFMLVGFDAVWHGIERVIEGLNNYTGKKKIIFYCIGNIKTLNQSIPIEKKNTEIKYIPNCTKEELDELLKSFHIGVGTLAAYRKKMNEASPLKVREYIARGFPIIIGYTDTDLLNNEEIKEFVYQVNNDLSMIDFNEVVKWYKKISQIENFQIKIQDFAKSKLDTSVKMNTLLDVLSEKKNDITYSE